jgi:hypothetical protein
MIFEQADGPGALHSLLAAVRTELLVQAPQVRPDRVHGQAELGGDLRRGQVGWQVAQHACLAVGDRLAGPVRFGGRRR